MLGSHVGGSLGSEIIEFYGRDSSVNTRDYTLRNLRKKPVNFSPRGEVDSSETDFDGFEEVGIQSVA